MDVYDRDGNPITMERWSSLLHDPNYKFLDSDDVLTADGRALFVSTVWLGLNHSFGGVGSPIQIFETMVFEKGWIDLYCERYTTEEEALAGHAELVQAITRGELPWDEIDSEPQTLERPQGLDE